jgi:hypothetical protein
MSTRSLIGKLNPDHTVTYIYCHFDGYPSGVGDTLSEHHESPFKVDQLLALGDLSVLGSEIGEQHDFDDYQNRNQKWCLAYGRDRGEEDTEAKTVTLDDYLHTCIHGEDFKYLYFENEWDTYDWKGNPVNTNLL